MKEYVSAPAYCTVEALKHPIRYLEQWAQEQPSATYLRQPVDRRWREFTYAEALDHVRRVARYLRTLQLPENAKIAIVSKNCAHWHLADLSIWYAGYVSVPLFANLSVEEMNKVLEHAEASAVFVGKLDDFATVDRGLKSGCRKIYFPYHSPKQPGQWDHIVDVTEPLSTPFLAPMNELATLIYTSGTTGNPKGVMHTFSSMMFSATNIFFDVGVKKSDRFVSYLPLSHVAERAACHLVPLIAGACVGFAESLQTFQKDLQEIRPSLFLGVPRIWEKFQEGVFKKIPQKKT